MYKRREQQMKNPNDKIPLLKAENLYFNYNDEEKRVFALRDINLEIFEGEYVAILGHNGSGKSTLAKLFNMILEPTKGKLYFRDKDLTKIETEDELFEVRKNIGMVFQNPDNQIVATIVEEDVAFGPENLGVESSEIRKRVDNALAEVGMTEYARHEPSRLSGGQKQRVAIAGLLAMEPMCMLFDESTSMLDPVGRIELINTIEKLNREKNITMITITHYMEEAVRADRVIVLDKGKIIMDSTSEKVFSNYETLKSAGLDIPQCMQLANELRQNGIEINENCSTPEKCADALIHSIFSKGEK